MSLRPAVNRRRIDVFLDALAARYHQSARLYLVGGTSLVFEGYRDQTLDVDIAIQVSAEDHGELMQVLRQIRDGEGINIEEVSPADFIPLPGGYESRHEYIGRFGQVEVFHFDWYSTALSKIERGRRQDLADVIDMLKHGRIEFDRLKSMYREILPLMEQGSLRQDPLELTLNFTELEKLWHSAGGTH